MLLTTMRDDGVPTYLTHSLSCVESGSTLALEVREPCMERRSPGHDTIIEGRLVTKPGDDSLDENDSGWLVQIAAD